MQDQWLPAIARILLSAVFVRSGLRHCLDFAGTQAAIASNGIPDFLAMGMAAVAIGLLLGGGCSILFGYQTRKGAIALILFLIPATLLFHLNLSDPMQEIQLLKNIGLMGGLLLLIKTGPGLLSLDGPHRKSWYSRR